MPAAACLPFLWCVANIRQSRAQNGAEHALQLLLPAFITAQVACNIPTAAVMIGAGAAFYLSVQFHSCFGPLLLGRSMPRVQLHANRLHCLASASSSWYVWCLAVDRELAYGM